MLESKWWVEECLYGDILYDDLFGGSLDVFIQVSGGVWYGDHRLFG